MAGNLQWEEQAKDILAWNIASDSAHVNVCSMVTNLEIARKKSALNFIHRKFLVGEAHTIELGSSGADIKRQWEEKYEEECQKLQEEYLNQKKRIEAEQAERIEELDRDIAKCEERIQSNSEQIKQIQEQLKAPPPVRANNPQIELLKHRIQVASSEYSRLLNRYKAEQGVFEDTGQANPVPKPFKQYEPPQPQQYNPQTNSNSRKPIFVKPKMPQVISSF